MRALLSRNKKPYALNEVKENALSQHSHLHSLIMPQGEGVNLLMMIEFRTECSERHSTPLENTDLGGMG